MTEKLNELWVRYVSNAGTLFWDGKTGIGVDIFCRDENEIYKDLPERIKQELFTHIEKGLICAIVITHEHSDHFDRDAVIKAWNHNHALKILTTNAVADQLRGSVDDQCLIIPVMDEMYRPVWYEFGAYRMGLMYTAHEGARYANVYNLGVFMECGGRALVITGDALPDEKLVSSICGWQKAVDAVFVPFPLVGLKKNRRLMAAKLDTKRIFAYHLPRDNVNVNWVNSAKEVCKTAEDALPGPLFLERAGKWYAL